MYIAIYLFACVYIVPEIHLAHLILSFFLFCLILVLVYNVHAVDDTYLISCTIGKYIHVLYMLMRLKILNRHLLLFVLSRILSREREREKERERERYIRVV